MDKPFENTIATDDETGLETQLTDERDWSRFLTKYHKLCSKKKELEHALATIDDPPSFPMFNNKSTKNNKSSTSPPPQPQNIFYPISLQFYNYPNYPTTHSQPNMTSLDNM
ncbi:hypothetical protein RclHR1_00980029 [Rhizophagus clarus]|uniref:Uncharacterized protein n=1 Tax=Rhizophagus clarus TaxID=94130 RepID=A0A2Z6SJ83_9GLOM|nr:hypothetical protein RclHR1_00980029 [Rhizophagus clarus]